MMERLILICLVVASLFLAQGVYWLIRYAYDRKRQELRRRLDHAGEVDSSHGRLLREDRLARSDKLHRLLMSIGRFDRHARLLAQTDLEWTVARVLTYAGALALLGGVLGLLSRSILLAIVLAALGAALPYWTLIIQRDRRSRAISEQLPDALEMLVRSLRAGHAIPTAIKLSAQELPTPIATELGRCYEEHALGASIEQAVFNVTSRVPANLDLKIFAVTIAVQGQVGGNAAETLENIAATIRERYKFYGQLRALTAEGRLSGWILGSMPWLVLVALWVTRRDYLELFFASPLGKLMSAGAFGLWVIGLLWMRKIAKVEV
jgi:tight adherence protein B